MAPLDDTDRLIVRELLADGRLSMRALAERVHLSRANAYSRVARLQRDGVITGFAAVIDPARYGYGLSAYVYLDIAQQSWRAVSRQVLSMPGVDHVAFISGEHDILLRVRTRDAASLRDVVLTRLQEMPEVRATQTVLIFEEPEPDGVRKTGPG
jgi:DNA-binding Lrp family transcriptional regulator